jgi:hypothetical protein
MAKKGYYHSVYAPHDQRFSLLLPAFVDIRERSEKCKPAILDWIQTQRRGWHEHGEHFLHYRYLNDKRHGYRKCWYLTA